MQSDMASVESLTESFPEICMLGVSVVYMCLSASYHSVTSHPVVRSQPHSKHRNRGDRIAQCVHLIALYGNETIVVFAFLTQQQGIHYLKHLPKGKHYSCSSNFQRYIFFVYSKSDRKTAPEQHSA